MNGRVSDGLTLTNYTAWVFIIGFNHNAEREGSGIAFQGFKETKNGTPICLVDSHYGDGSKTPDTLFKMNDLATNNGGWASCKMRQNIMPLIKASFSSDLQVVIKPSTIFTAPNGGNIELTATEDDVFLLAEYEVFGAHHYASTQESNYLKQYAYYSAGNSKKMYKHNSVVTAAYWWERSPYSDNTASFCDVFDSGGAYGGSATISFGMSPCFKV